MALIVVEELHAYLITQGVAQAPDAVPSETVPSVFLQPRQDAPTPREGENQTVTLVDTNLSGPPGVEAWLQDCFIDIIVRSRNDAEGKLLHRAIHGLLAPIGQLGGRKHWRMNELLVQESRMWRQERPMPTVENGLTYDRAASFQFRCARSDLG